jgi:thiol-disulfide isomerase/thioredoxin
MAVFGRLRMPSLGGATGWLNSEPLGPAELQGRVVLFKFWTLTCINWLRQEPYVRAWSQAYRDDGLIVIGVHTPEFSFEHEIDGVRQATEERAGRTRDSAHAIRFAGVASGYRLRGTASTIGTADAVSASSPPCKRLRSSSFSSRLIDFSTGSAGFGGMCATTAASGLP